MMRKIVLSSLGCLVGLVEPMACIAQVAEPREGIVAQLDVDGDLDSRVMTDEIVNWFAKRDNTGEVLAVLTLDGARARPDLVLRIVDAVQRCSIPVAVHLDARGLVEPQMVLIGLASSRLTAGRGVTVSGSDATRLNRLIPDEPVGWKGQSEQLARSVLAGRDKLLLDVFVPPLGDVYLHDRDGTLELTRESQTTEDVRIVDRINEDEWHVGIPHDVLIDLNLAVEANGLGQVLRANNIRAFRRERTEVQSGLGEALETVLDVREHLATESVRLTKRLKDIRSLRDHEQPEPLAHLRTRLEEAISHIDTVRGVFSRYPELYRMSPPWMFDESMTVAQSAKVWAKSFESLSEDLTALRTEVEAMERP